MSGDRIVIGGTDCTEQIKAIAAAAPPLNAAQWKVLARIFAPVPGEAAKTRLSARSPATDARQAA